MTLNITVLSREYIYQSADFRLTNSNTGKLITDRSGKAVSLNYREWSGFVTYTGLGRWEGRDISAHVADWLGDGVDRTMSEVADHLAEHGTRLLTEVRRDARRWIPHSFTLAGFEDGTPRAFVISNFEDCFGTEHAVQPTMAVTSRALSTHRKGTVIVTGRKKAVPSSDRSMLGNLAARYPTDGGRIRRRMQAVNARAAASPASGGAVSADCVVLSFRSDGSGVLQLSDEATAGPSQFPQVTYGRKTAKMLEDVFKTLGIDPTKVRLVQGASGSLRASGPRSRPGVPCAFAVRAPDGSSTYSLAEITAPDFEPLSARDISDSGHVVGTGRLGAGAADNIPWIFL
ncbi:MAG: hypothetical protein ACRDOK_09830, partial [Streptosporangiaceae bacterium]